MQTAVVLPRDYIIDCAELLSSLYTKEQANNQQMFLSCFQISLTWHVKVYHYELKVMEKKITPTTTIQLFRLRGKMQSQKITSDSTSDSHFQKFPWEGMQHIFQQLNALLCTLHTILATQLAPIYSTKNWPDYFKIVIFL